MKDAKDAALSHEHRDGLSDRDRLVDLLLAATRKRRSSPRAIAPRGQWDGPLPLSYAQERLWFLDQLGLVKAAYILPMAMRLEGELNVVALERSFVEMARRHESLRTRFGMHDGVPYQIIDPEGTLELSRVDLSHIAEPQEREQHLQDRVHQEQVHPFDLHKGPLARAVLVRLAPCEHVLLVTIHHIVSDGWSLGILKRELGALYSAYFHGVRSPLPELRIQYADYAIAQRSWLEGETLQHQLEYWRQRLLGAPSHLDLPTDRPRPAVESFRGAELKFELPTTLVSEVKELGRREGATLFMVVLTAYQILLSLWSGQRDIVVGSPIAGRNDRDVEGLIGFFVNTLVLRTHVRPELTFMELLKQVREETLEAYAHQELPFDALVKELRPERNLTRQPIFQVMLALQSYPEGRLELDGVKWTWSGHSSITW